MQDFLSFGKFLANKVWELGIRGQSTTPLGHTVCRGLADYSWFSRTTHTKRKQKSIAFCKFSLNSLSKSISAKKCSRPWNCRKWNVFFCETWQNSHWLILYSTTFSYSKWITWTVVYLGLANGPFALFFSFLTIKTECLSPCRQQNLENDFIFSLSLMRITP